MSEDKKNTSTAAVVGGLAVLGGLLAVLAGGSKKSTAPAAKTSKLSGSKCGPCGR